MFRARARARSRFAAPLALLLAALFASPAPTRAQPASCYEGSDANRTSVTRTKDGNACDACLGVCMNCTAVLASSPGSPACARASGYVGLYQCMKNASNVNNTFGAISAGLSASPGLYYGLQVCTSSNCNAAACAAAPAASSDGLGAGAIAGIVVGVVAFTALVSGLGIWWWRRLRRRNASAAPRRGSAPAPLGAGLRL